MSAYPIAVRGEHIHALVVGGGAVAVRKVRGLLASGATVRVVAPAISSELTVLAQNEPRMALVQREYQRGDVRDALLVVAATDSPSVNGAVADEAVALGRMVNVADAPERGTFDMMAIHRAGDLTIAVSANGVPGAAARIRDRIAVQFGERYGVALGELRALRTRMLSERGPRAWRDAAASVVPDDLCDTIEDGRLAQRMAEWR